MTIQDRLYKNVEITEPTILKLIQTKPFQRLKRINQYGGVNFVYPTHQVTRYEHSIGVWHVLRTLGATFEVQVAGLLHDIGHTALSHMVDMAMENNLENLHEQDKDMIEGMDEIDQILNEVNLKLNPVDSYPEIKKALPNIGADRLDYAIRDYVGATGDKSELGPKILQNITFENKNIVFTDQKVAKEFAITGLDAMWLVIYEPNKAVIYQALIEMLKEGMSAGWINKKDLFADDQHVFDLFKKHQDQLDPKYFKLFTTPFTVAEVTAQEEYDYQHTKLKIRYFDPLVIQNGSTQPLSQIDDDFTEKMEERIKQFEKRRDGVFFKVTFS